MFQDLSLPFVFLQGLLSFLSPCVLPLAPAYLAMLAGNALPDAVEGNSHRALIRNALLFTLGFTLIFVMLGATATAIGAFLTRYYETLRIICGVIIVLLGIFMTGIIPMPFLEREHRIQPRKIAGPLGALVMGGAFGLGWTPCIGPALASVLMLAARSATVWKGVGMLFVYALGLALPFLLAAVFLRVLLPKMRKLNKYTPLLRKLSGALLIILGVMMATGSLSWFATLA